MKKRVWTRRQIALGWIAAFVAVLVMSSVLNLCHFIPVTRLRAVERELGWGRTETVLCRYGSRGEGLPIHRFSLSIGEEGFLFTGMYFRMLGWEEESAIVVPCDPDDPIQVGVYNVPSHVMISPTSAWMDQRAVIFGRMAADGEMPLDLELSYNSHSVPERDDTDLVRELRIKDFISRDGDLFFWAEVKFPYGFSISEVTPVLDEPEPQTGGDEQPTESR